MSESILLHATAVAIDGQAVLLRGPSGSGKSDLALRLIDAGARLVADDQSELQRRGDVLLVRAPATIAGLFEVRGLGILRLDALAEAPVALIADLVPADRIERMPPRRTARNSRDCRAADRDCAVRGLRGGEIAPCAARARRPVEGRWQPISCVDPRIDRPLCDRRAIPTPAAALRRRAGC